MFKIIRFQWVLCLFFPTLFADVILLKQDAFFPSTLFESQVHEMPKHQDIKIDGNSDDWKNKGLIVQSLIDHKGRVLSPQDLEVDLKLAWNDKGILIHTRIKDDHLQFSDDPKRLYQKDSIEIYLGNDKGDQIQCILAHDAKNLRHTIFDQRIDKELRKQKPLITCVIQKQGDVTHVEAIIPWKNIGFNPALGKRVRFQFFVNDFDPERNTKLKHALWFPQTGSYRKKERNHWLVLNQKASPPVQSNCSIVFEDGGARFTIVGGKMNQNKKVELKFKERVFASGKMTGDDLTFWSHRFDYPHVEPLLEGFTIELDGRVLSTSKPVGHGFIGPMVCHINDNSAYLWAYAGKSSQGKVVYRLLDDPHAKEMQVPFTSLESEHHVIRVRLDKLKPNTSYRYEFIPNKKPPRLNTLVGSFKTSTPKGSPTKFKMAFTSCLNTRSTQSSWYLLHAERPDFHMLLGDIVYADTTDASVQWRMHVRQRILPEFAAITRNIPTYACWDDHDYGANNSDGTLEGKEKTLQVMKHLFINPGYGTPETPGIFHSFSRGDVDFIVLDTRYHRSPNRDKNDEHKRMLGDAQFAWLKDKLINSKAKFKVIASGTTMIRKSDGWKRFDFSRKRLFQTIAKHKVGGVVYLSGDLHKCTVKVHPAEETAGYPFYEIVSSGITNGWKRGFATLEFDTHPKDPTMRVKIVRGDTQIAHDEVVKLSQISP